MRLFTVVDTVANIKYHSGSSGMLWGPAGSRASLIRVSRSWTNLFSQEKSDSEASSTVVDAFVQPMAPKLASQLFEPN